MIIALLLALSTCGVERWAVKAGYDADVQAVRPAAVATTVEALRTLPVPVSLRDNRRAPQELVTWAVDATLVAFKAEADHDYHLVLQDASGRSLVAEIPDPGCLPATSRFKASVARTRATFDRWYVVRPRMRHVRARVRLTGVGFFDKIHGQTGVAPNGIELHPVLSFEVIQ